VPRLKKKYIYLYFPSRTSWPVYRKQKKDNTYKRFLAISRYDHDDDDDDDEDGVAAAAAAAAAAVVEVLVTFQNHRFYFCVHTIKNPYSCKRVFSSLNLPASCSMNRGGCFRASKAAEVSG